MGSRASHWEQRSTSPSSRAYPCFTTTVAGWPPRPRTSASAQHCSRAGSARPPTNPTMTSEVSADSGFVWIFLPGAEEPVVAGRVDRRGARLIFGYGSSYLGRADAVSIYEPELPLRPGSIEPPDGFDVANCLLDAAPDSWGRRVILNRLLGPSATADVELDDLTFLLSAGSDRIGALDFQRSPTEYVPRGDETPSLEDLAAASELIQAGGARPGGSGGCADSGRLGRRCPTEGAPSRRRPQADRQVLVLDRPVPDRARRVSRPCAWHGAAGWMSPRWS